MELEEFELVILRRPAEPTAYDEETLDRIQREHLAYLAGLRETGAVVVNGSRASSRGRGHALVVSAGTDGQVWARLHGR